MVHLLSGPASINLVLDDRAALLAASLLSASLLLSLSLILMDVASIFRRLSGRVDRIKLSEKASRKGNLALMAARSWSDM
jgi:hypothetical protein